MVKNPETGEKEEKSKIGAMLTPGAAVTLHRSDVDIVVTEYGVAELRGKTVRERALALVNIAHPDFREELMKEVVDLGIMGEWR